MRYAIIENGKVANIAVSDSALEDHWVPGEGARIGDDFLDGQFITPPPDASAEAEKVRAERNAKLTACDWTQVADAPVDKVAWSAYRQALRDVPAQAGFPFAAAWPKEPK